MSIGKINKLLLKIFGSRNERLIKNYNQIAAAASEFDQQLSALGDNQLKAKTSEFKDRLKQGQTPEQILPEAFAVVRQAAWRNLKMRHFDVQLIGGAVLYEGKIAEMATGEGKTLVATLAGYLVHLTGKKVHVITVNDYLAKRDSEWMSPIYNALGLTVGAIQADMDTGGEERKQQYLCDITYGTNNEFGFDYLRDNMKISEKQLAQGPLDYAIIDEVDSILIDEARTPLIISGPAFDDVSRYKKAEMVAREIIKMQSEYSSIEKRIDSLNKIIANTEGELSEAKKAKDSARQQKAQDALDKNRTELQHTQDRLFGAKQYYEVEYDRKSVHLNHDGLGAAQELAGVGSFFTGSNMDWPHLLQQSLRAHVVFEREKDYVVMDGKVVIVDEFTGRLMHGRQWSDGLHQAVEAKEGVTVKEESQTLATITFQNFFRLYEKISGMTGTAATEAEEFMQIYKLEVVTIPTNKPCVRDDCDDVIYKSIKEKFDAIVEEVHDVSSAGQPVLVGTISVEKSEAISKALKKKYGVEHEVLNAKQHAREAQIVEKAGCQYTNRSGKLCGNVTIATNMAGRGTDIKLGDNIAQMGGLHIVGTERHDSRRIDNQLRGRAGRQGDAGSSQFFLCFDDDLLKIFAPDWTIKALSWVGWEEGQPIQHRQISRGIEKAQKKVEQRNYETRKSLLEYDEVMDYQRKIFYSRRRQIIAGRGLKKMVTEMIESVIETACGTILNKNYPFQCIGEWASSNFGIEISAKRIESMDAEQIERLIKKNSKNEASTNINIALGEYLEDFEDPKTWNIEAMCKWAMSAFSVNLSANKVRQMTAEEIEQDLITAAAEQIEKKNCSQINRFLESGFKLRAFINWAESKFAVKLDQGDMENLGPDDISSKLLEKIQTKYDRRQIDYPVEFAMSMTYRAEGTSSYAFESLAKWVSEKFGKEISVMHLQNSSADSVNKELLQICEDYYNSGLENEIEEKLSSLDTDGLCDWAKQRFKADIAPETLAEKTEAKETLLLAGNEFLRTELSDLERYVLLQIYDSAWKDHLYSMDHLKESIFLRGFAEKDPKIEYKQEGFRMFREMLDSIDDKVTDAIFKVRLEAGTKAKSVFGSGKTQHDKIDSFSAAARQQAAAQRPQGEAAKPKQIILDQPKVGRNAPCPCGSGKKYKKCCGRNA